MFSIKSHTTFYSINGTETNLPCGAEGLLPGDGVWASALTHAIGLKEGDVQAHEILKGLLGNWSCPCKTGLAAVEAQGQTHLSENQLVGNRETPRHHIIPGINGPNKTKLGD